MFDFLLTATDENGKRATHHIEAETATEAYSILEKRGFRDITLHTDDAMAAAMRIKDLDNPHVTLDDRVRMRYLSELGFFWFLLRKLVRTMGITLLVAVGIISYRLYTDGRSLGWFGALAVAYILLPVFLAAWFTLVGSHRKYRQLLDASAWGRWNEVLERTEGLRGSVPDFELDARRSCALAALGRFDEASATFRQYKDSDEPPRWMYFSRMSEVFIAAHQYDKALRCQEASYQAAPDSPIVELDYAMSLLNAGEDTPLAKQLIDSAKTKPLGDLLEQLLPHIEGLYYLSVGQDQRALESFEKAQRNLIPIAGGSPLIGQVIDINKAQMAIAQARLGNHSLAMQTAEPALKRLRAINSARLLRKLEATLRLPAAPVA